MCMIRPKVTRSSRFPGARRSWPCRSTGAVHNATLLRTSFCPWPTTSLNPLVNSLLTVCRESVQPRMLGMPMYNSALEIEVVDFERRDGRLCGVLLTPWCMNLVVFPEPGDEWRNMALGKTIELRFPSGSHSCLLSALEGMAPYLSLPLFTTVEDFENQDTALRVAREVLHQLFLSSGSDSSQDGQRSKDTLTRRELLLGRRLAP